MKKIKSFEVDHTKLGKGFYIARIDGDIVTYDLRFCKPNTDDLLDHSTMHTLEHMAATYIRNSDIADNVVYFGPMGCQTGFYLLLRDSVSPMKAVEVVKKAMSDTVSHKGEVFGNSEIECGNYRTLNLEKAKIAAEKYLKVLDSVTKVFTYEEINSK